MLKIVLFQTIQFSISTQFSSIWPINRTLSSATTPGQSGLGSDGNEGVVRISQSSNITGTSPSDCFVSYAGHSLVVGGGSYPFAELQSVYFTALTDWPNFDTVLTEFEIQSRFYIHFLKKCSWERYEASYRPSSCGLNSTTNFLLQGVGS